MATLQDFMTALRSGNIEQANQHYDSFVPRSTSEPTTSAPIENKVENEPITTTVIASNSEAIRPQTTNEEGHADSVQEMDKAAILPNKNILNELKSIRDMIREAKDSEKINDPTTLKAIAARHRELLSKLIDDATQ
jgi:hypothetical protein